MPSITDLPCEIVGSILGSLDHLRFLPPALLACRHFSTSFKESHGVEASILRHQITPALLPYAVAVTEASRLPRPLVASAVFGLLDELYRSPARLGARVSALPLPILRSMGRTHDVIQAFATGFATSAWQRISPSTTAAVLLSPNEYFRFCRAFYRVELFFILFRDPGFEDNLNPWFLRRHHPWENEQLGSAYEYLEERFAQASVDVVAHDIDFGEMGLDYLATGGDNPWKQGWLSHGVKFVYNLMIADSYDVKHSMLHATVTILDTQTNLPEALQEVIIHDPNDDRKLVGHSEAELYAIAQRQEDRVEEEDTERGPYETWREANADRWVEDSCMLSDAAWLRKRAYVFWDGGRLRNHPGGLGEDPGGERDYTMAEHEEMMQSFDERSKFWLKGGRGYWSKNDTSRITYPPLVMSSP